MSDQRRMNHILSVIFVKINEILFLGFKESCSSNPYLHIVSE